MDNPFELQPDQFLEISELAMILGFFRKEYDQLHWWNWLERQRVAQVIDILEFTYAWVRNGKPGVDLDIVYKNEKGDWR